MDLYLEPLSETVCGTAAPNHPEALLARFQVFQAVGENIEKRRFCTAVWFGLHSTQSGAFSASIQVKSRGSSCQVGQAIQLQLLLHCDL